MIKITIEETNMLFSVLELRVPVAGTGAAGALGMRQPGNLEHDVGIHNVWGGVSGDVCVFGDFRAYFFHFKTRGNLVLSFLDFQWKFFSI